MAIYYIDFNLVKRSQGKSACAKAAYHARCKIKDERTGNTYNYSRRTDLGGHFILAPLDAPKHIIESSSALWNEVERVERQKNGQTARYFQVAIPRELDNEDKIELVKEYCQKNFVDEGMIADIAFHDLDSHNPHAHVMLTLKNITPNGFTKKNREWNEHSLMDKWRSSWTDVANKYLANANVEDRIDHRTVKEQREEAINIAKQAKELGDEELANKQLAKAIELNRPTLTYIHRNSWHTERAKSLHKAEQEEIAKIKQAAQDFRQLFTEYNNYISVNIDTYRIEKTKKQEKENSMQSTMKQQKPVLVAPVKREHHKSDYYGMMSKASTPPLIRNKRRRINLQKNWVWIVTVIENIIQKLSSVTFNINKAVENFDEQKEENIDHNDLMVDPVTRRMITKTKWEEMAKGTKTATDENYHYSSNKNKENDNKEKEHKSSVKFPSLPNSNNNESKNKKGYKFSKISFNPFGKKRKQKDI